LVACRAAVYGALVPASRFVPKNGGGNEQQKKALGRAHAKEFLTKLCQYPSDSKPEQKAGIERATKEAQRHILEAHAERLTNELRSSGRESAQTSSQDQGGLSRLTSAATPAWIKEFNWPANKATVTVEDILAGRAPRPRALDMFAGGGAIPLEALRLGCEAYALDLNPVAHIIELCTLVYPQKFGKPDPNARGMTGPKNAKGETTWGGLANEVRYWGEWVLKKVKAEIGDLYPLIPDPEFHGRKKAQEGAKMEEFEPLQETMGFAADAQMTLKPGSPSAINHQPFPPAT
jgi:putative DNA methylase